MLPKRSRLTAREVEKVLTEGRFFRGNLIHTRYILVPGSLRASVVVSKSVAKLSTRRNSARRALYRALAASPSPKKGAWAVFFLRRIPDPPLQPQLEAELKVLLKNIS